MATKTTGSGRAPGLETWNPNIKAPGINKGTGAYFRGDVAEEPDYTQMNDAIQSSILQATKDVGKALNTYENDPSNPNGKGSLLKNKPNDGETAADTDMTIGKISSVTTEDTQAALDNVINEVAAEETRGRAFRRTNKNKPVTFKHLTRKGKIKANKRADEIGGFTASIKDQIQNGWIGADPGEIDWGNWGKHKNAQSFFSHLIHGDASIKYEQKNGTTVATWMEGNTKKTITKTELDVARDMWGSNKEGVASYEARYKKDGALIAKNFTATQNLVKSGQLSQDEADTDMNTRIEKAVQDNNTFEDRQYIWNNVLANTRMFQDARTTEYDPEATLTYIDKEGNPQSLLHKDIVDNYKEAKLREYAGFPPKAQMKPETNNNNNNSTGSGFSETSNPKIFNEIMQMSSYEMEKLPFIKTLQDRENIDPSLLPSKLAEKGSVERQEFEQLKNAYNGNLSDSKLKEIVNWGVENTKFDENGNLIGLNWDNYNGNWKKDSKKVFEKWQELYSDSLGSQVKDESKREEFANLISRGGYELRSKVIDYDNPPQITQDKDGTVITFYTKKGEDGLESESFPISTENGRRALYQALTNATDAKFNQTEADFTAMLKAYMEENKK